jgi:hypothetical protein
MADLGWPRIRAANQPLATDAGTIAGPWDGTPVDYGTIVVPSRDGRRPLVTAINELSRGCPRLR